MLPILRDVDTAADAYAVARLCPRSRFAKLLRRRRAGRAAHRGGAWHRSQHQERARCGDLARGCGDGDVRAVGRAAAS